MVKLIPIVLAVILFIPAMIALGELMPTLQTYTTDTADTGNVTGLTGAFVSVMPLVVVVFMFLCLYLVVTGLEFVRD